MSLSHGASFIIGNWKMHKTVSEAEAFVKELLIEVPPEGTSVGLAVPFTALYPLSQLAAGSFLQLGAQNMNAVSEGAFTGEIAARMLKDAGASFVLLGHSERRRFYGEDNQLIQQKVKKALEAGITPLLCVGENIEDEEAGRAQDTVRSQLTECLAGFNPEQLGRLLVAYEPVWATGSNKPASPEKVQEMHHFCRQLLIDLAGVEAANQVRILYGGSVSPENAPSLLNQVDVNGLLVGGASLSIESFRKIVNHESLQL